MLLQVDDRGVMSHHLNTMVPGDRLEFKGPMGGLALDPNNMGKIKKLALIAGGAGISAMIQIIRSMLHRKDGDLIDVCWSVVTPRLRPRRS